MLNVVQQINHRNVCSQGLRLLYKTSSTWKTQDKRMLELTTNGLYGHGECLNCLAAKLHKHGPYETYDMFGQCSGKSIAPDFRW